MLIIPNSSIDITTYVMLKDTTNKLPKTDCTVTDIDLYYIEEGAAMSAKVDCLALGSADAAHTDNSGFHIGEGIYRIDWPDAAFDGGVRKKVYLVVVHASCVTEYIEVLLSPAVGTAEEVTGAVGSIATGGIAAASFAAGAINAAAIANDAIDATAIADNAITANKLATGAITATKFAAGAIDAAAIADDAIDAAAFADNAITSAVIANNALTADKIATGAITSAKFAAGAINAAAIAPDAIGASELAADAVAEIVAAMLAGVYEGTNTLQDFMRLTAAVLLNKCAGGGTSNITFRDDADTKDRITVTVDANGNRSVIVKDAV
jgi:hypothetical protein